jgi:hypothetical protein
MAFIIYKEKNIYIRYMNNSERIYNIEETVSYLASKIEKDNRLILSLIKKLIDKLESIERRNNYDNDLSRSIQI